MTALATGVRDGRSRRWLAPILFGSLALNLVMIGAAGSLLWRSYFEAPEELSRRVIPSVLGYSVTTLPPERVKELERLTKVELQEVRPARRALQEAREEWVRVLGAEPFDRERLLAAQSRLAEVDRNYRGAAMKLYLTIGLNLTPEERRGFASWREEQREGRPRHPLDVPQKPASAPQD